jgi:hypothetical protein
MPQVFPSLKILQRCHSQLQMPQPTEIDSISTYHTLLTVQTKSITPLMLLDSSSPLQKPKPGLMQSMPPINRTARRAGMKIPIKKEMKGEQQLVCKERYSCADCQVNECVGTFIAPYSLQDDPPKRGARKQFDWTEKWICGHAGKYRDERNKDLSPSKRRPNRHHPSVKVECESIFFHPKNLWGGYGDN